jgi:two-component system, cell cycle sensor histidine kinase and response regulator CckA
MAGAQQPDAAVLEGWLDALFATSTAAMAAISTFEGRYLRVNTAMLELFGMTREELLEADPFTLGFRLSHPDDIPAEQALFAELAAGARRSYELDKRFIRADGSFRWGRLTFSAIFAEPEAGTDGVGPIRFVLMHIVDITEQRALAEALVKREDELRHAQKIDGIGRLAAGIAHDFNNLLTVIIGHGLVLKDLLGESAEVASDQLLDDLDSILSAADRAASLTAQILAHGRRETVAPRVFLLSNAVEPLRRLFVRTIGSNITVEESLLARGAIYADPGQVGQIVMNLILNARDAMPDGGRILVSTHDLAGENGGAETTPGPGAWVALVVSDTGHGMTPEVQARMFEPFFTTRGDRPGTQGTGLGLATVRRIVSELGAKIEVKSAPAEGTSITIFFPRVADAPAAEPRRERQSAAPAPNGQRVLVIEDEPSVRALVASILLGAGYWVTLARNGGEGLRLIEAEKEPFELVITDLMMPEISGAKLAKLLEERGKPPRMLFISGYANITPAELQTHGHLLPKPFTPAELLAAVAYALK